MDAYPRDIRIHRDYKIDLIDGLRMELMEDGNARSYLKYAGQYYDISITHPEINSEQLRILLDFYNKHRLAEFIFYFCETSYRVKYAETPQREPAHPGRCNFKVRLYGVLL